MATLACTSTSLAGDIARALAAEEIRIVFQPITAIAGGDIVGVEALARWRHPVLGELGAETLFKAAGKSDHLAAISNHVQRRILAEVAAWPAELAHLRVSLNVTAVDIDRPGFARQFLELVRESGLHCERITVEVTESELITDLNGAAASLTELRAGGLRIAIDDFGTGYANLIYLKALPLDYLKIDKSLCDDITGSARDRILLRSIITLARDLGLIVIAEGVESQEQIDLLGREGCALYQGFFCSHPLTTEQLRALVSRGLEPALS